MILLVEMALRQSVYYEEPFFDVVAASRLELPFPAAGAWRSFD